MLQVKRHYHSNLALHLYTYCLAFTRAHGLQLSSALGLQSLLELHWRSTCPQLSHTTCSLLLVSILATPAMVYEMYVFPWPLKYLCYVRLGGEWFYLKTTQSKMIAVSFIHPCFIGRESTKRVLLWQFLFLPC